MLGLDACMLQPVRLDGVSGELQCVFWPSLLSSNSSENRSVCFGESKQTVPWNCPEGSAVCWHIICSPQKVELASQSPPEREFE